MIDVCNKVCASWPGDPNGVLYNKATYNEKKFNPRKQLLQYLYNGAQYRQSVLASLIRS